MSVRVLVGSSNEKVLRQLGKFLIENGFSVVGETVDGYELLRRANTVYPDLVLVDYKMKGMSGHQISEIIISEKLCPVVALITNAEMGHFINLNQEPTFVSLIKPLNKSSLLNTITLMDKTAKSIKTLEKKVAKVETTQDKKSIINQAKKLLMKHLDLTEHEAHRRIQKQSMDQGMAKVKVAEMLIDLYET